MNKQHKLTLISLLFGTFLSAQTLTLQESIDKTLENHPDIKSSSLKIKQSESSYKSSYASYLPQVNLDANYNVTQTFVLPQNGTFNTIDDDGWSATASVKQKIWDFSQTSSKVDAANIDKTISQLSLKEMKALLVYKVKSLYETMIVESEAITVREKDLEAKIAYYKQSLALVKEGLKTKADASRFLSAVYSAKENLAAANASFDKAKTTLSLYMGEDIQEGVLLQTELLKQESTVDKSSEQEILNTNYTLKISTQNIEKNLLLHKSAKAKHYGSIDAIASYSHVDTLNAYDAKLAGITFSIPLYSGGRVSAESQKAKIGSSIAIEQKASQELALKDEFERLIIDIKHHNKTIEAKKAEIESAKETKKVLDGRYTEGLSTYIEVLDATSIVLNAKLGLLEAYYLKSMAINRIEYLKGKI